MLLPFKSGSSVDSVISVIVKTVFVLVTTLVRQTFPMSKSSIKTKTVLTMTDMTESTELPDLKDKSMVIRLL